MVTDFGQGTLMADNEEEAIWWHQAEETKLNIIKIKASTKASEKDLKMSARELHQKFLKGARAKIKLNKVNLIVAKEILRFYETKINYAKDKA